MVTRRKYLAAVAGGTATVSIAGCGLLSDSLEASASPGGVPESVRSSTGFADEQMEKSTWKDTREVAGEERDLKLTNWTTEYTKVPAQDNVGAAGFVIFSSPTVSIADRSFNPFDQFDEKRLIRAVLSRSSQGDAGDLKEAGSENFSVFEESVEFTEYESTQSVAGRDVDMRVHIGNLTHDGDLLTMLGTYPEVLSDLENVKQMAEGTDHPVDTP
jgi:hypothetical protein